MLESGYRLGGKEQSIHVLVLLNGCTDLRVPLHCHIEEECYRHFYEDVQAKINSSFLCEVLRFLSDLQTLFEITPWEFQAITLPAKGSDFPRRIPMTPIHARNCFPFINTLPIYFIWFYLCVQATQILKILCDYISIFNKLILIHCFVLLSKGVTHFCYQKFFSIFPFQMLII